MSAAQRRTRRVTVYLSPETFSKLEALAEQSGNLTHSSVVSLALARLFHSDSVKRPKKANGQGDAVR